MKIGIFGGSFNPPHKMHKHIALELIKRNYVDKVIFVPVGNLYKKSGLIDFSYRFDMVKLITNDNKLELNGINNNKQYKFTYQVLDYFKNKYKNDEIYFICGADNLEEFSSWTNYQYILENYKLLVVKRLGVDDLNILKNYYDYKENIIVCDMDMKDISSTKIRSLISSKKLDSCLEFIDLKVLDYIKEKGLYIN